MACSSHSCRISELPLPVKAKSASSFAICSRVSGLGRWRRKWIHSCVDQFAVVIGAPRSKWRTCSSTLSNAPDFTNGTFAGFPGSLTHGYVTHVGVADGDSVTHSYV